jgi:hypothetical protein
LREGTEVPEPGSTDPMATGVAGVGSREAGSPGAKNLGEGAAVVNVGEGATLGNQTGGCDTVSFGQCDRSKQPVGARSKEDGDAVLLDRSTLEATPRFTVAFGSEATIPLFVPSFICY